MFDFKHFFTLFRFKTSKQFLFSLWAGGMVVFTLGVIVYCAYFLAVEVKDTFDTTNTSGTPAATQFDIKGFERLNLTQKQK